MVEEESDVLDEIFAKANLTKQELNETAEKKSFEKIKKKPLHSYPLKKAKPAQIKDNIDFLNILDEFVKDPQTDKSFFISEENQKFLDSYCGPKDTVKKLLWLRFLETFKKIPPYRIDDFELLFCLLSFSMPIRYTYHLTKCLLEEYKTLEEVLTAPAEELRSLLFKNDKDTLMLLDLLYAVLRKCAYETNL